MNPVLEAATELQRFLESQRWNFCVIGGLANSGATHQPIFRFGPQDSALSVYFFRHNVYHNQFCSFRLWQFLNNCPKVRHEHFTAH